MLSIVIVSYNTEAILKEALARVYRHQPQTPFEVIVVDNASSDNSCDMVERDFPQVNLIRHHENGGFAAGTNIGMRAAQGATILLLNSDAYVFDGTLQDTIRFMEENPDVGVMGPQLVCEDGSPQPSARPFPNPWLKWRVLSGIESRYPSYETHYDYFRADPDETPVARRVDWVPGTYFVIRRELIDQIGLLDERFFMYFEEVDFCYRASQAGWDVVFNPAISVIHLGGQSSLNTKKEVSRKGRMLVDTRVHSEYDYYRKHNGLPGMLLAAGVEIGWKSLIWLKNRILRSELSEIKYLEAGQDVSLVWHKIRKELRLAA
jgi:N-acetylglucosaminyl-diphospho-decaprenol L-rhamnosyltransferase